MNNTYKIRRENLKTQKTKSVWDADALVFLAEYQIKVEKKKYLANFLHSGGTILVDLNFSNTNMCLYYYLEEKYLMILKIYCYLTHFVESI